MPLWGTRGVELRLDQLLDMHQALANSNTTVAVATPNFGSHKPMLHLWLKIGFGTLFALSALTLVGCFSLAFAGGWVGRYASLVEMLGFISFCGCIVFGLVCIFLFRDVLTNRTRSQK